MSGEGWAAPPTLRVSLVREGSPLPGCDSPGALARVLLPVAARDWDDGREWFGVACLDARHRLIGLCVVSIGCLTASLVHPREVFGPAIVAKAAAIVAWHTHPSCDTEPSAEDQALTRRLAAAGSLLGIELLDHLVLASDGSRYVSMKQRGIV